ncbi:MAG: hypothetical protein WD989_00405 [Candidatus Paceibacterota bacterium]
MRQKDTGRVLRTETSFSITPIVDKELLFTNNTAVLLVSNISDREIARRDYEKCLREGLGRPGIHPDQVEGKYAAFGMPGGGVSIERADTRESAARTEMKAETGLSVLDMKYLFTEGKTILRNSRTQKVLKQFFHKVGEKPSIRVDTKKHEVIENPVHIFLAQIEWENSPLRQVMLEMRDKFLKEKEWLTKSYIKERGVSIFFDELTQKQVVSLDIEEIDEIDGIAVVPLERIQQLQDELRPLPREKRVIYLSHTIWINRAITQIEMQGI